MKLGTLPAGTYMYSVTGVLIISCAQAVPTSQAFVARLSLQYSVGQGSIGSKCTSWAWVFIADKGSD